jgi:RimJ/RimL family protein N-acetyltransferase
MRHALDLPKVGEDIIIRQPKDRDLEDWYELESDPFVMQFLGGAIQTSRTVWISKMVTNLATTTNVESMLAIESKQEKVFAGRCSIARIAEPPYPEDVRELQVVMARRFIGLQLGKQAALLLLAMAFGDLNATKILGVIHPEHGKCRTLCSGLGFVDSGKTDKKGNQEFILTISAYNQRLKSALHLRG